MASRWITIAGTALLVTVSLVPTAASAQYWGAPPPPRAYYYDRGEGWYAPPPPPPPRRVHARRDYRHCSRGSGGTILGAIAGGLLGNAVAGRGDRGVGALFGAGAGALAGRAIDRDC